MRQKVLLLLLLSASQVPCHSFWFGGHYCRWEGRTAGFPGNCDEILGLFELFLAIWYYNQSLVHSDDFAKLFFFLETNMKLCTFISPKEKVQIEESLMTSDPHNLG